MQKRNLLVWCFIASVASLVIFFCQSLQPAPPSAAKAFVVEQQVHNGDLTPKGGVTSTVAKDRLSLALPAPFVIQSHLQSLFLFEIFSAAHASKEEVAIHIHHSFFYPDVFFRVVFTLIICPNAP